MPAASRTAAALVSIVAVGAGMLGLTGCANLSGDREYHFSRYGDAPKFGTRSFPLDDWVPTDASGIDAARSRADTEEALLRFTTDVDLTTSPACAPSDTLADAPSLSPSWWPRGELDGSGLTCGDWSVVSDGTTVYAWRG